MRHKPLHILFLFLTCLMAASCDRDRKQTEESEAGLKIQFQVQENAVTRYSPAVSEALLNDICIFVFNTDGAIITSCYIAYPDGTVHLDLNTGVYRIYAIANCGDITQNQIRTDVDLQRLYWTLENANTVTDDKGGIPMSGAALAKVAETGSSAIVRLTRLLAKFRIIADISGLDSTVSSFDIYKVRIRNMNRHVGYFYASAGRLATDILSMGTEIQGEDLRKIYTTGIDFYIPENLQGNLLTGNTTEQGHVPPEPYDRLCTYVEFYVKYRSSEHYCDTLSYRYYLHNGINMNSFDLKRNTMYTCITTFKGSGLDDNSWRIDVSGLKDLVTSIQIDPAEKNFYGKGDSYDFTVKVQPASAENPDVVWSVDNTDIATVDMYGRVTALSDGDCILTATAADGSGVYDQARISVFVNNRNLEFIDLPNVVYPNYNSPFKVNYEVFPQAEPLLTLQTVSGSSDIATLTDDGYVYAYNPRRSAGFLGAFKLTGEANNMSGTHLFTVNGGQLEIDNSVTEVYVEVPAQLSLSQRVPSDVPVEWSVNDPSMAFVDENGLLSPFRPGTCTVRVESVTGIRDSIDIIIREPYLHFEDVTIYEGSTWELSSYLMPISAKYDVNYTIEKGSEYITITGDSMYGSKRTNGFEDVVIRATVADYPHITATARVEVLAGVSASLLGDNRVVNTYGHSSDGANWSGFKTSLQMDIFSASNLYLRWFVTDESGNSVSCISVSESGVISAYSSTANGKYYITGWDHQHRFKTDVIEIEVYQLLEYEVGISTYSLASAGTHSVYIVNMASRWSQNSWNRLTNTQKNQILQQKFVTYPASSTIYRSIGGYSSPSLLIESYNTGITRTLLGTNKDLSALAPLSYLRPSFMYSGSNVTGISGVYYQFNSSLNSGLTGYFYVRQRNEVLYNSSSLN